MVQPLKKIQFAAPHKWSEFELKVQSNQFSICFTSYYNLWCLHSKKMPSLFHCQSNICTQGWNLPERSPSQDSTLTFVSWPSRQLLDMAYYNNGHIKVYCAGPWPRGVIDATSLWFHFHEICNGQLTLASCFFGRLQHQVPLRTKLKRHQIDVSQVSQIPTPSLNIYII